MASVYKEARYDGGGAYAGETIIERPGGRPSVSMSFKLKPFTLNYGTLVANQPL